MQVDEIREYCLSLKGVSESFPFDSETLVFKVKNKMFCLMGLERVPLGINVKCDPELALELREEYQSVNPGWHMNKKHWNTITIADELTDAFIKEQIEHSYSLIVKSLPKKLKQELENE